MMFEQLSMCYGAGQTGTSGGVFSILGDYSSYGKFDGKMSNGSSRWYCSDLLGRTCNIYLGGLKSSPGYLSLTVEFSDYVWFYVCKPSK